MKADLVELSMWMIALRRLEKRELRKRGVQTEASQFFATWWGSLWDGTSGGAWKLATVYFPDLTD